MYKFLQSLETRRFRGLFHFRANGQPFDIVDWLVMVNVPATYALTGVEVGACQKPQLADYVPAAYWLSG